MNNNEIKELDEKFEGSHILVELDVSVGSNMTQSVYSLNINDNDLIKKITIFAKKNSQNLQELFEIDEYVYLTCFSKPDNLDWLDIMDNMKDKYPSFLNFWESSKEKIEHITISFPVIE